MGKILEERITVNDLANSIPLIQRAKHGGNLRFGTHALLRMFERRVSVERIEQVLDCASVEVLENYPKIGLEQSKCLILGVDDQGIQMHVSVTYPHVEVITMYEPTPPYWITPRQRGK